MISLPRRIGIASLLLALSLHCLASDCSRAKAKRSTVSQIAQHAEEHGGACVLVDGVMRGDSLFENVDGVYLEPPESMNPSSNGLRLGLDNMQGRFSPGYRHVTVIGRVQDCETVRDMAHASDGEDSVSYVSGYCHSFDGAYLWVEELKLRKGPPFYRQMGAHDRADYGDLEPVPASWPHRAMVEGLAGKFLTALRASDRDALANIHYRDLGLKWKDDETRLLEMLLKDGASPFASLRQGSAPPQMMILASHWLLHPDPNDADELRESAENFTSRICFCRTADCSGRWPIANLDADNLPSRPYACTEVEPYVDGEKVLPHFTTEIGIDGLAEPASR